MIKGIVSLLFGVNLVSYCELHFTEEFVHVVNVDKDVSCTHFESIFDSDNLDVVFFSAQTFKFPINLQYLILMGTELTSQQIADFESNQIDVQLFDQLLIVGVLLSNVTGNHQQNVNQLVQVR